MFSAPRAGGCGADNDKCGEHGDNQRDDKNDGHCSSPRPPRPPPFSRHKTQLSAAVAKMEAAAAMMIQVGGMPHYSANGAGLTVI